MIEAGLTVLVPPQGSPAFPKSARVLPPSQSCLRLLILFGPPHCRAKVVAFQGNSAHGRSILLMIQLPCATHYLRRKLAPNMQTSLLVPSQGPTAAELECA